MHALACIALVIFAGFWTLLWLLLDFVACFAMIYLLIVAMDFISRSMSTIRRLGRTERTHDIRPHAAMTAGREPRQGSLTTKCTLSNLDSTMEAKSSGAAGLKVV
jgi:hypothetical protein